MTFEKLAQSCLLVDRTGRVNTGGTTLRAFWAVKRLAEWNLELPGILSNHADERAAAYQEFNRIKATIARLKAIGSDGLRLLERYEQNPSETLAQRLRQFREWLKISLDQVRSVIVLPYGETIGQICGDLVEQAIVALESHQWQSVADCLNTSLKHLGIIASFKRAEVSLKGFVKSTFFKAIDEAERTGQPVPTFSRENIRVLVAALDRIRDQELTLTNFDRYQGDYLGLVARLNAVRAAVSRGDLARAGYLITTEDTDQEKRPIGLLVRLKEVRDKYG